MLDFPSASLTTAVEALEGPTAQIDWNSMISEPPVTSLEEFMFMGPVGDKTSLCSFIENGDTQSPGIDQVATSIPSYFQETYTINQASNDISSWSFNVQPQVPSPEIHLSDIDNMNMR